MKMLKWIHGNIQKDRIQNEEFCSKGRAAPIDQKMRESYLRKFNRVQRRTINAVVGMSELIQVEGMKKG